MPQYKLTYFNIKARGEVSRMLFAVAGQEYEDCRLTREEFNEMKPSTPFGQLPLLEVDGQVICQSRACGRYLARQFGLAGKTEWDRAKADMVVDAMEDLTKPLATIFFAKDEDKPALLKTFKEDTMPKLLSGFEKILEGNTSGFFVGDEITWADMAFLNGTDFLAPMSIEIDATKYPKCVAVREKVQTNPKIAEWIKKRPDTPF